MSLPVRALNSRWIGLLLVLWGGLSALADPPSLALPGRAPDSKEPWGFFLGRAAHVAIGLQYRVQHPSHVVFVDTADLSTIVDKGELGNPRLLSKFVRLLRPDITDTRALVLFEIKPDNEDGAAQARRQAGHYLAALNEVARPDRKLVGGTGFEGSLFVEFKKGAALWQLSWRTPEPGVTLYRWSYRRAKTDASWKELAAQKEEPVPEEEIEKHGAVVEQAVQGAYGTGEWPDGFEGRIYLPVDCL